MHHATDYKMSCVTCFSAGEEPRYEVTLTCIILIGIHVVIIVEYATVFKKSSESLYERVRTKPTNMLVDWASNHKLDGGKAWEQS